MESGLLIGIDHGGTNTTALVLDPGRGKLSSESVPMPKHTPARGWVEHDPEDFLRTSVEAAARALVSAGRGWRDVAGVGIANQGETSMAWSRDTGMALGPALSWEDRRTASMCESLAERGVDDLIRARTGILLDPYFSASKFRWLVENVEGAGDARRRGMLRLGGTDSYVISRLTRGAVRADGGPSRNRYLMQRQADLLGMPVSVSLEPDMTALGAALLAGIGAGQLTQDDVADMAVPAMSYEPDLGVDERGALWMRWRRSIEAVCKQARE